MPVPQLSLNYIGHLQEVCFQDKIALPTYNELQDVGPPHMKSFTYQCQIGKITTVATAGQKKVARHTAAKEMLDK